jgi:hypothetical protein
MCDVAPLFLPSRRHSLANRQKSCVLSDKEVLTVNRGNERHEVSEIVHNVKATVMQYMAGQLFIAI